MTEARRKKIMYGILVVAIIWGAWNFAQPRKTSVPNAGQLSVAEVAVDSSAPTQASFINVDAKKKESWGRDPFSGSADKARTSAPVASQTNRAARSSAPVTGWSLTGIIDNGTTPFAFINGKMVKVGDMVDRAKVVIITRQKVVLSHNGNEIALKVNKG